MDRRQLLTLAAAAPALGATRRLLDLDPQDPATRVLSAALSFGRGGGYDRSWKGHGVPADVEHRGARILSKDERGSYCCGFTFAAAMKALTGTKALARLDVDEVRALQKAWYGARAEFAEAQCAAAVERFRVGRTVPAKDARAGDFCQLWRVGDEPSGHSVLFLAWVELAGERAGLCYLSSQGSTGGIGYGVEFLAESGLPGGRVDPDRLHFGRLDLR